MKDIRDYEIEIEFRNVARTPIRWFGWIYPAFIALMVIAGTNYTDSQSSIIENNLPAVLPDTSFLEKPIQPEKGISQPGVNILELAKPNDNLIAAGKKLFDANCTSCHGTDGMGNGPASAALNPKPRNFHSNQDWINGRKISQMYKTLQEGIPNSAMAPFNFLSPADRISLIHYVRTFAPDFPVDSKSDLENLDKIYSLSQGITNPSHIPVSVAIQKVIDDSLSSLNKTYRIMELIDQRTGDDAVLFKSVAKNRFLIINTLARNSAWAKDLNSFDLFITSNWRVIGFKPGILALPAEKKSTILAFLKANINSPVSGH